jgi:hypothetical protein
VVKTAGGSGRSEGRRDFVRVLDWVPMARHALALLLAAFLALACGSSDPEKQKVGDERNELLNRSMITLEAAPAPVREEVLKLCDKWRHLDRPCVDEDVRIDQLECWLEEGIPALQHSLGRRIGPRARNSNIMLRQNLCMEQRRWRKVERGPDF